MKGREAAADDPVNSLFVIFCYGVSLRVRVPILRFLFVRFADLPAFAKIAFEREKREGLGDSRSSSGVPVELRKTS